MNVWSIMVEGHKVKFVSLTGEAEIVNAQGSDKRLVFDEVEQVH